MKEMDFDALRKNLKLNYSREYWKEWLQFIFGLQVRIDANPDVLFVQKGSAR